MERMLIVKNPDQPKSVEAALMLGVFFAQLGMEYDCKNAADLCDDTTFVQEDAPEAPQYALAVVLGGDGAILKTASYVQGSQTPILGINFGHLGFLSNPADDGVVAIVSAALAGDVTEERRTNVSIKVEFEEDTPAPTNEKLRRQNFFALNELSVERGLSGRVVDIAVMCNGQKVYTTRGNGMVVASATGSTAYGLSAGGPLVSPAMRGLVAVPLAPHHLNSRALVTAPGEVVELTMVGTQEHKDVRLFIDGRPLDFDAPVKSVQVTTGAVPTTLLRYKHKGFYDDISRVFFG